MEAKRGDLGVTEDVIEAPSPPRHELFKLAHQRKTGSFTTDQSASVASKIVSKFLFKHKRLTKYIIVDCLK